MLPERKKYVHSELLALLDARFGHRDFLILSKRWKGIHYEQVVKELLLIIDMEIEYAYTQQDTVADN